MSISISIGSSHEDIENLQKTKDIVSYVYNLMKSEDQETVFAAKTYTRNDLANLSNWYGNILDILYNAGTQEEIPPTW